MSPLYGGAAARSSVPSLGDAQNYVRGLAGSSGRLAETTMASPTTRRLGMHLFGFGVVALGGALTGWLVSSTAGSRSTAAKGALVGAVSHVGLYALTGAIFGSSRLTTLERTVYGLLGLSGGGFVGYLFYRRTR